MKKEIKTYKVADLELNSGQLGWLPRNPRQWTRQDIDQMAASIKEDPDFIQDRPPLVVPLPGKKGKAVVFAHNLWTSAAKDGKLVDEVSCYVYTPENDADRQTIVRRALKDNGTFGSWDWDILANEWPTDDAAAWGVPVWEGDAQGKDVEENTATEDDFDEAQDEIHVVCKLGDIWQLGDHRLMCGDSISLEDVQKLVGGEINALITDPPYNVDIQSAKGDKIMNDNMSDTNFRQFLQAAFSTADAVLQPGAVFYIWHADSNGLPFREAAEKVGWKVRQCLIWNKNHFSLGRQDYQWKHEPCLYGWKDGAAHYFFDSRGEATVLEDKALDVKKLTKAEMLSILQDIFSDKKATTVIDCDMPIADDDHPTMKPVKLIGYLIRNSTKRGDAVLDVFGGSGTTLIAAEQLGRRCYMMELDPHYCDVIIARWEKLTGKQAKRIN